MAKAAKQSTSSEVAAILVFGFDKAKKPRAGWFTKDETELVTKAATALGFHIMKLDSDADRKLATKVKPGRAHQPGDGFVPAVGRQILAQIAAVAGVETNGKNGKAGNIPYRGIPRTWEEIAPGHLVLAQESPKDGWYEAIVIGRDADRFKVRWRDYSKIPAFERPIICIALPCPLPSSKAAD